MMKRVVVAAVAALLVVSPLVAQTAKVLRLSGKVEIMRPKGAWTAAAVGDEFPLGSTVSTGFKSQAVLAVGPSQLTVLALTRLTVQELMQTSTGVTTTLNLDTGKVRAEVKSAPGQTADFKLRSPVSTAAVRGTDFLFDGFRLDVIEGVVQFFNLLGESRFVSASNGSRTDGSSPPTDPGDERAGNALVSTDTGGSGGGGGSRAGTATGRLTIVVEDD
jgi:hypothetical protein